MNNLAKISQEKENLGVYEIYEDSLNDLQNRGDKYQREAKNAKRRTKYAKDAQTSLQNDVAVARAARNEAAQIVSDLKHQLKEAHTRITTLEERLVIMQREKDKYCMRDVRMSDKLQRTVDAAIARMHDEYKTCHVKDSSGVILDDFRSLVRDMVADGVPSRRVMGVIERAAIYFGKDLDGCVSVCSIGRITMEGLVGARMQLADEMMAAEGIGLSGDGTTHKHIQYEAKHISYTLLGEDTPMTRTLGVSSALDHRAATQIQGWKDEIETIVDTRRRSPGGQARPGPNITSARCFAKAATFHSDHASDAKKVASGVEEIKVASEREVRGEDRLLTVPLQDLMQSATEETEAEVASVGGTDA
ncbi:hypothetical protein OF83DRAFT_1180492 [Amylostereum chailletii]|nr:hypothetical protein OF83DRAFT_1180492 [Amylostereum chailletii]